MHLLQEEGIEDVYIEILKEIYTNSSMTVHLQKRTQQDQHQERSTSRRYHIAQAVHGSTRKHIPTTDLGNHMLEDSHLRFAHDIPIFVNTPHELQQIIQDLADESEIQGMKMKKLKTCGVLVFVSGSLGGCC